MPVNCVENFFMHNTAHSFINFFVELLIVY